jgi:uncharacterized protein (TIGR02246 family)
MNSDQQAIRDLVAKWLAATKAGDTAAVLSLMADDVIFMVPGQAPFGKEAFAAASKGMAGMQFESASDIQEIEVLGDRAWMRSRLRVTITPPGSKSLVRSGYILSILRKNQDGTWVVARDANLLTLEPEPVQIPIPSR